VRSSTAQHIRNVGTLLGEHVNHQAGPR